jgi:Uma2 family endonuclease
MAQPTLELAEDDREALDRIELRPGRWTAQRALAELPELAWARLEVLDGSLVVSPPRNLRHQTVVLELGIALKRVARAAGFGTHTHCKVVVGEEMVGPDLTVATRLGDDTTDVTAEEVVLVADVVLPEYGRAERLGRPLVYTAGKIGYYLRVDLRDDEPMVSLYELADAEYRAVALASVGARFSMRRPFPFDLDPASLSSRSRSAVVEVPPQRGVRLDPPAGVSRPEHRSAPPAGQASSGHAPPAGQAIPGQAIPSQPGAREEPAA